MIIAYKNRSVQVLFADVVYTPLGLWTNSQRLFTIGRHLDAPNKLLCLATRFLALLTYTVNLTSFAYCLESYSWEAKPSVQKSHTNYSNMFQTFALNTKVKKCNKNSVIPWKFCFCRRPKNSTFLSSICLCWPTFAHRTFKTSNPTQLTFLMIYNDAAVFFVTYCCQNLFWPLKINNHSLSICLV